MKRIFCMAMAAAVSVSMFATNRMGNSAIVANTGNLSIRKADRVAADIKLIPAGSGSGAISVSVKRSPACATFYIECMTSEVASMIPNDEVLISYLHNKKTVMNHADMKKTKLVDLGFALNKNTEYTLFTVAFDKNGKTGEISKTVFKVPEQPILGSPQMRCEILSKSTDKVSIRFTPNDDVAGYGLCVFPKGSEESELATYKRTMGLSTVADMVKRFSGKDYKGQQTKTWKDLIPDTEYDFCVQMWDKNGIFLDVLKFPVRTEVLGGAGIATVAIEVKEFGGSGATGYFQFVVYTPNDQAALHRDIIITEEAFNKADMGDEGVIKMLKTDSPQDPFWNQYGVDKAQWNVQPNTAYIACSIARNANGKWGPLKKLPFVTPSVSK